MPGKRKYETIKTGKRSYKIRRVRQFRTTRRRTPRAPRGLANMRSMIRNVQLSQAETNFKTLAVASAAMNHDTIYSFPIWGPLGSVFPVQGTTDHQRIGDRITAMSMKIRMCITIPWDRQNVKLKMYYLPYNSDQGDPTDKAQLFHSLVGNTMVDPIQFKTWKGIQYLGTYRPKDNDAKSWVTQGGHQVPDDPPANRLASNDATIYVNKTIKFNRRAWFRDAVGSQPMNFKENGTILILPYASTNTATTDTVVRAMEGAYTLYYKDL